MFSSTLIPPPHVSVLMSDRLTGSTVCFSFYFFVFQYCCHQCAQVTDSSKTESSRFIATLLPKIIGYPYLLNLSVSLINVPINLNTVFKYS